MEFVGRPLVECVAIMSFAITIVMARLLGPSDFGLVAMATVFTGISLVFIDLGTKDALVRTENLTKEFISTIFWTNIFFSFLVWLILIFFASSIADLYDQKVVQTIVYVMSLNVIVSGVTITFQARLERQMRFKPIAFAQIISRILSATVGVTMAISGYGVWGLVFMNAGK